MSGKTIGSAEFKAVCLRVIDQMNKDHESVTITKRGEPVALLTPIAGGRGGKNLFGAMKGSVLRYDAPTSPVGDESDWEAAR